ncbi:MAG TPA: hypothetical protein VFQ58_03370, partial [Flavisolibacter sp.]|nr:hypothetical protein [Flavisolibacter sp.]
MLTDLHPSKTTQENSFRVNYPYLGLFGTADITLISDSTELICSCKLLNGNIIRLKKNSISKKWIDTTIDKET